MCITTKVHFSTCSHAYLSRASRCMPSQLSHGKFCEGQGVGGMDVEGLCPGCCEEPAAETEVSSAGGNGAGPEVRSDAGRSETETSSSAGGSAADAEGCAGGEGEKKEIPGPGSYLDDIPGFEIRDVEKCKFSAWGLGRGVGIGMGREEVRKPRKLQKARKVPSVKRAKVRMVLEEEGEEL